MFPFSGWQNYDHENFDYYIDYIKNATTVYAEYLQNLVNYVKSGGELKCTVRDLRDGFPEHSDNSIDIINFGQAIEHISPHYDCPLFLKECHRMLKPGGYLRITTPDLDLLINAYLNGDMNKFASEQPDFYLEQDPSGQFAMLCYGSSTTFREEKYAGHKYLYTQKSMTNALNKAGFTDISFYYEPGKSKNEIINKEVVDSGGANHSFIVEAIK